MNSGSHVGNNVSSQSKMITVSCIRLLALTARHLQAWLGKVAHILKFRVYRATVKEPELRYYDKETLVKRYTHHIR